MIEKIKISINGKEVDAFAPLIISASRATDIPAFYGNWIIKKFKETFIVKKNPFNNKRYYISLKKVRFIVFWSKNPKLFFDKLSFFDKKKINYYFLFTLNDYPEFELNLPALSTRIQTFKELSNLIGKEKVIWRFDPIIICKNISINEIIFRIENIAKQIHNYTEKLIISFVDLSYKKVQNNLRKYNFNITQITEYQKFKIAELLEQIGKKYQLTINTCAEKTDLSKFNIHHNKCIDDELIAKIAFRDKILMKHLLCEKDIFTKKIICQNAKKDKGQRKYCNCIETKDIGFYDSCPHQCLYCYANKNFSKSTENFRKITKNGSIQ